MTIREKALENLINKEAMQIREELSNSLKAELDSIHESIKKYPRHEGSTEYISITCRLDRLRKAGIRGISPHEIDLLELDYDEVAYGK